MPNIESAIKRVRQNETANTRNSAKIASVRTAAKRFEEAAATNADNKEELFRYASKVIDSAASKGLIHANKAAREKSRLAKKL
ncbi:MULTISPECIES: 30S ribosomal protein S20 [Aerococcus]|jgi:small subunit ribosomal protein S20|uniref:Small ribosomal subunit protein bS20 n=1 Tax=Aerococcus agrisoli TaxID=2487350 RepID=A0A3N4GL44_9LACT|nr:MULTISPECIES: 30S ribosomal protein S20 [Aerococcus]OYQ66600.1 30S ribosomal protein S20 [Aerococcus sp. 1KP-2016]RPA61306.1 30S ribosomal protein S20 [Aerococcus agrisoli]